MRAVLDPNILISALLSPTGAPAGVLNAWLNGHFDLVVSPLLLSELRRALTYPKLADRIPAADAAEFVDWIEREAIVHPDPAAGAQARSADPGDEYLIALAESVDAVLVSGDHYLLDLAVSLPIQSARELLDQIRS